MRALDAYADLRRFGKPVVTTGDVAVRLRTTLSAASRILGRLKSSGLVKSLKRGLWSLSSDIDPLVLPEYLTAPFPAYVSLQSALYLHGMISQIPQVIFVASLGRTRRITTSIGTYSIHRLVPEFLGGYRTDSNSDSDQEIKMATPEKALLDVLYLAAARSRLFARLPELELPRAFSVRECRRWIAEIPAAYRRKMVTNRLEAILARQGG
ncbi:MAG: type IV toxin-antitoxin system AbiEi family antitoxin domain-containing protein [Planctomycetota bacterium]|jgi:predicted transcriptional regulator of viral defense system